LSVASARRPSTCGPSGNVFVSSTPVVPLLYVYAAALTVCASTPSMKNCTKLTAVAGVACHVTEPVTVEPSLIVDAIAKGDGAAATGALTPEAAEAAPMAFEAATPTASVAPTSAAARTA